MFFNSSPKKKLQKQYKKLISEAHKLSTSNRSASDQKYAEADAVAKKIEALND